MLDSLANQFFTTFIIWTGGEYWRSSGSCRESTRRVALHRLDMCYKNGMKMITGHSILMWDAIFSRRNRKPRGKRQNRGNASKFSATSCHLLSLLHLVRFLFYRHNYRGTSPYSLIPTFCRCRSYPLKSMINAWNLPVPFRDTLDLWFQASVFAQYEHKCDKHVLLFIVLFVNILHGKT